MYYLLSHKRKIMLSEGKMLLGRDKNNDIVIEEKAVSRFHAEIELRNDVLTVTDLDSTNGTMVNGKKITSCVLKPDDTISIGRKKYTVMMISDVKQDQVVEIDPEGEIAFEVDVGKIKDGWETLDTDVNRGLNWRNISLGRGTIQFLKKDIDTGSPEPIRQRLAILLEVSKALNAVQDVNTLLGVVMDMLFTIFNPDGAVLALLNKETGNLEPVVTRWRMSQKREDIRPHFSRSIAKKVFESGKAVVAADAAKDSMLSSESIISQNIRSVACVPLQTLERNIGVIYVDHRLSAGIFDEEDLKFIAAFASTAAIAIERSTLHTKLQTEQQIRTNLERYLSPSIVDNIVSSAQTVELGTERRVVTSVFVDIRNFTQISSTMEPKRVVDVLNYIFNNIVQIIFQYEGTLDKYLGDGLLAMWGAPFLGEDDAYRAVQASIDMVNKVAGLNEKLAKEDSNHQPLWIGIGINTGTVLAGNIGSEKRMEYTIIGDDVNIASRLCEIAKPQEILLGKNTWNMVQEKIQTQNLDPVKLKGKPNPVPVYKVIIKNS